MPVVLRISGFKFYFYANEGSEPPHIHVDKGDATAKLWLTSREWVYSHGFSPAQRRRIENILERHQAALLERWDEFFAS
jgi:hypothetical protein